MKKLVFFVFFVLLSFAGFSQSKKISALPTAVNLNSSYVPIIQDSSGSYVNRKFPGNSFRTPLVSNGLYLDGDTVKLGGYITDFQTTILGESPFFEFVIANREPLSQRESFFNLIGSPPSDANWQIATIGAINTIDTLIYTSAYIDFISRPSYSEAAIHAENGGNIAFYTSDKNDLTPVERLKIDSVGNVSFGSFSIRDSTFGVYTTDLIDISYRNNLEQSGGLAISENGGYPLNEIYTTGGVFDIYTSKTDLSNAAIRFMVDSVGLITLTPTDLIVNIASDAGTTGEYLGSNGSGEVVWGTPSDRKLKKNIHPITGATKKILALDPVNFTYKKGNEKSVGFIAQDVQKVLPEMVSQKDGYLSLKNVTYLEPYIISTIQELEQRICELEKKLYKAEKKKHRPRYERKNQY